MSPRAILSNTFIALLLIGGMCNCCRSQPIVLDGTAIALVYDGHGALSAGASSRLLIDYPEPQRSQILDYLFKPNFGANLHLLKVEIGGDTQSTDGTETSHMHFGRDNIDCTGGYEFWLLQEAKARNPDIVTYALSWGMPGWVGNGSYYTDDSIFYHVEFMRCTQNVYNITLDYMGIWNERPWGNPDWVKRFRGAMDDAGFVGTKIVIPDGGLPADLLEALQTDVTFNQAIDVIGLHYPCNHPAPQVLEMGKKYWSSEDYSTVGDWHGAGCWGRLFNENYLRMNMTSTISWSLIWSVYPNLPYYGNGLMYAYEPWTGHYTVNFPIWTSAHTCQFTKPGWFYLAINNGTTQNTAGSGSGYLPQGGSYVTLVPPATESPSGKLGMNTVNTAQLGDFSLVIEKLEGNCLRCKGGPTVSEQIHFQLSGGLGGYSQGGRSENAVAELSFWCTNNVSGFEEMKKIGVDSTGMFSVSMSRDSVCTVSTLTGQAKGEYPTPPDSKPFPLPYKDNFDVGNVISEQPLYFTDQGGSFRIVKETNGSGNKVLMQVAPIPPGGNQWGGNTKPISMIGFVEWADVASSITVKFLLQVDQLQTTGLCHRYQASSRQHDAFANGLCILLNSTGDWEVLVSSTSPQILASGHLNSVTLDKWYTLGLNTTRGIVKASIDGQQLADVQQNSTFSFGYIALTTGWHLAMFDNFTVEQSIPPPPALKNSFVQYIQMGGATYRNDFTGLAGGWLHVEGPVKVTALGRYKNPTDSAIHLMSIVDTGTGQNLASVNVSMATSKTDTLGFVYSTLATPLVLAEGHDYYLVSMEMTGGDHFYGYGPDNPAVLTSDEYPIELFGSSYFFQGKWAQFSMPGHLYGPLNMLLETA